MVTPLWLNYAQNFLNADKMPFIFFFGKRKYGNVKMGVNRAAHMARHMDIKQRRKYRKYRVQVFVKVNSIFVPMGKREKNAQLFSTKYKYLKRFPVFVRMGKRENKNAAPLFSREVFYTLFLSLIAVLHFLVASCVVGG